MTLKSFHPGLIRSDFLFDEEIGVSWQIWFWKTREDLQRWADNFCQSCQGVPGEFAETRALHSPEFLLYVDEKRQHMGSIHFVKDGWDLSTVSHEVLHALFHYIRVLVPDFPRALYKDWMEKEEALCYPFGDWVEWIYRWLWKYNPNPRWQKEKTI